MVCGLLCLQLSRVLFSQCQSAANGSVGAGLHFFSILLFPSNGCIQMQPRMTPAAQDKRMQIKRRLLQFVAFSITLIIPQHQTSSEPPENSMLGRIDPLWSERVSTQQCCASDFVSVCKMKVVSGSHRDSLSCLWHKGLASECLLPKKMLESEEENILRQRVLSHSVLESFGRGNSSGHFVTENLCWSSWTSICCRNCVSENIFFFQLESVTSVFARKETCEPVFLTFVSSLKCLIRPNPNSPLTPAAQPHASALCVDTK